MSWPVWVAVALVLLVVFGVIVGRVIETPDDDELDDEGGWRR